MQLGRKNPTVVLDVGRGSIKCVLLQRRGDKVRLHDHDHRNITAELLGGANSPLCLR